MPKVSIIITSLNHDKYLRESIESVLNQTFKDYELFIWDDASSDNSWEIIKQYSDPRIRAFRNEFQKTGVYGVNKVIFELSKAEYIAIHHSDDVWESEKLEKQVAYLDANPEIGAVFTRVTTINEEGASFVKEGHFYSTVFEQPNRSRHEWLNHFFYKGNALCHPSVLIRKTCYDNCGSYRYGFGQLPDFDMWVRLCMKHDIHIMPERLVRFRVRNNEANTSGDRPDTRIRTATEYYKIFNNYLQISSLEEFSKIFPDFKEYQKEEGFDPRFMISMVSLEKDTSHVAKSFGVLTLFDLMLDKDSLTNLKRIYGFGHGEFVEITGKLDIFNIEIYNKAINYESRINELENIIKGIECSRSWQITKPLRWLNSKLKI